MTNDKRTVEMKKCESGLAKSAILYTDTVGGKQTLRDDLWAVSTEELNAIEERLKAANDYLVKCNNPQSVATMEKIEELEVSLSKHKAVVEVARNFDLEDDANTMWFDKEKGKSYFRPKVPMDLIKNLREALAHLQDEEKPLPSEIREAEHKELIDRLEKAYDIAAGLHSGSVKMTMSIPPEKDRDTDMIICDAIRDAINALKSLDALKESKS